MRKKRGSGNRRQDEIRELVLFRTVIFAVPAAESWSPRIFSQPLPSELLGEHTPLNILYIFHFQLPPVSSPG